MKLFQVNLNKNTFVLYWAENKKDIDIEKIYKSGVEGTKSNVELKPYTINEYQIKSAEDIFEIINPICNFSDSHRNMQEKYPFISSMYDPTDPGHTRGPSDYFVDQLFEIIEEHTEEEQAQIRKEIQFISMYSNVEIY